MYALLGKCDPRRPPNFHLDREIEDDLLLRQEAINNFVEASVLSTRPSTSLMNMYQISKHFEHYIHIEAYAWHAASKH